MFLLNGIFAEVKPANLGLWCSSAAYEHSEETVKTLIQNINLEKTKISIKRRKNPRQLYI